MFCFLLIHDIRGRSSREIRNLRFKSFVCFIERLVRLVELFVFFLSSLDLQREFRNHVVISLHRTFDAVHLFFSERNLSIYYGKVIASKELANVFKYLVHGIGSMLIVYLCWFKDSSKRLRHLLEERLFRLTFRDAR